MSKGRYAAVLLAQLALTACGRAGKAGAPSAPSAARSSSLALGENGRDLFVVNPEARLGLRARRAKRAG
jgi:hypothetical protein